MGKRPLTLRNLFIKSDIFGKKINMTFESTTVFKTCCGAVATVCLGLLLFLIFVKECLLISEGKLAGSSYMILNKFNDNRTMSNAMKDQVLGFAFEEEDLDDPSFLSYRVELVNSNLSAGKGNDSLSLFDCADYVYSQLSNRVDDSVPENLAIKCIRVSSRTLRSGFIPKILFTQCQEKASNHLDRLKEKKGAGNNPKNGKSKNGRKGKKSSKSDKNGAKNDKSDKDRVCRPKRERDERLSRFRIWAFSLADESDFTVSDTTLVSKFTATRIAASNNIEKESTLTFKEVEVQIMEGIIFKHVTRTKEAHMLIRNQDEILSVGREGPLLSLRMKIDKTSKIVITKTFKSYADAVAFIGGFSKSIGLFLFIFVWPVREVLFYKKLINEMFSVCVDKKQCKTALEMVRKSSQVHGTYLSLNSFQSVADSGVEKEHIDFDEFRSAVDINDGKRTGGLMDDIHEQTKITKDQYEENLKQFLEQNREEGEEGEVGLGRLLAAGMNFEERRKSRFEGVELTLETILELDSVKFGLKRWLLKARQSKLQRERSSVTKSIKNFERSRSKFGSFEVSNAKEMANFGLESSVGKNRIEGENLGNKSSFEIRPQAMMGDSSEATF